MRYDCSLDTVTKSGTNIGSRLLVIDETDTSVTLQFTQSQSGASCPLVYALEFYNEDTMVWYTYSSESFVHTQSNSSPTVRLFVPNAQYATYDQDPWYNITARITVTSTTSI